MKVNEIIEARGPRNRFDHLRNNWYSKKLGQSIDDDEGISDAHLSFFIIDEWRNFMDIDFIMYYDADDPHEAESQNKAMANEFFAEHNLNITAVDVDCGSERNDYEFTWWFEINDQVTEAGRKIPKSTPTRFQKAAKTANLDGKPIDPKKLMPMIHKALNNATGWKWQFAYEKVTPELIHVHFYYEDEVADTEMGVDMYISWKKPENPMIMAWISSVYNMITMGDQHIMFKYRKPMTSKLINTMWTKKIVKKIHSTFDVSDD